MSVISVKEGKFFFQILRIKFEIFFTEKKFFLMGKCTGLDLVVLSELNLFDKSKETIWFVLKKNFVVFGNEIGVKSYVFIICFSTLLRF